MRGIVLRKSLTKIIPPSLKRLVIGTQNRYFDGYAVKSYSQEGGRFDSESLF